ncbi:MAG: VWA domain-containing protein [Planctomycetota bacterium]|nr:VWA domain-containing protein [Planctomycetota bacterium]
MRIWFDEPWWFWLMLALIPSAWVALRWLVAMNRLRRWVAIACRALVLAVIAALLARASVVRTSNELAVVALADLSGSAQRYATLDGAGTVQDRVRNFLDAAGRTRGPDDLLGLVAFDAGARAVATPSRGPLLERAMESGDREGSDLASALRLGAWLVPPGAGARLLLISDGNQTSGDALAEARRLASAGVRIDVAPLRYNVRAEVYVESLDAPPSAPAESTVRLRATIVATTPVRGLLTLTDDGRAIEIGPEEGGRVLELPAGRSVIPLDVRLDARRVHRFVARFEPERIEDAAGNASTPGDTVAENNRASAFTLTPGRGSVLLVRAREDRERGVSALGSTLRAQGIDVTELEASAAPSDILDLQSFDLVMLENVPADELSEQAQRVLASSVRDLGTGLVMVGGPNSFAAGGWRGSVLEPLLPVNLQVPDEVIVPEVAIVLVLDTSNSMSRTVAGTFRTQAEIANEAAALAILSLDRRDLVGVIAFNANFDVVQPLQRNSDARELAGRVRGLGLGGGTNIGPAMLEGARQLRESQAKSRHLIVLSDGQSVGSEQLPDEAKKIGDEGIRVSTIAVGDRADVATMERMAVSGGGTFYNALNPSVLPRIFLKAVRVVRSPLVREEPFTPIIAAEGSPLLRGLPTTPPLNGLNLARVRPEATVVNALLSPKGEPVLASWNVELGQVAAFTSDASRWAEPWAERGVYAPFWAGLVRTLARPSAATGLRATTEIEGDQLRIRLDARDAQGLPMDFLTVPVSLFTPEGASRGEEELRLQQVGPGLYEGLAPARSTGTYIAVVRPRAPGADGRAMPGVLTGAAVADGAEFRALQSNDALLKQIAEVSGGRVLDLNDPTSARLFDRADIEPRRVLSPVHGPLLVWLLGLVLLDIATRRIAWDRFVSAQFGRELSAAASAALKDRSDQAAGALGALRGKREERAAPASEGLRLTERDAASLAAAQRDLRRARRLAEIQSGAARSDAPPDVPLTDAQADKQPGTDIAPEPGSSSLLAAKRRAAEKYRDE